MINPSPAQTLPTGTVTFPFMEHEDSINFWQVAFVISFLLGKQNYSLDRRNK